MRKNQPIVVTRRRFLAATAGAVGLSALPLKTADAAGSRRLSKRVFVPSQNDTGVFPGFVTYIDKSKPVLLHRFGWVDASDTYDNFHEMTSPDNGKTWTEPELKVKSIPVEGGLIRYIENAAFFDEDTEDLFVFVSKFFYPNGKFDANQPRKVEVTHRNMKTGDVVSVEELDFGRRGGVGCSFCFPIKTASGRLVVPLFSARVDETGTFVYHPKSKSNIYDIHMMLGSYTDSGAVRWELGDSIQADDARSTRGFSESTPVQLRDGRLALLCRGSNAGATELPGHKWLCFSEDDGRTWTEAVPLPGDDGSPIESSATGSALFRSLKNGKVYFIGNVCRPGEHANGNWPRSPLYIAEMQEEPFALKRDTLTIIDERDADDTDRTQISNFRYYQDRGTGDVVVYATRFGENDVKQWKQADYYEYRIAIGD